MRLAAILLASFLMAGSALAQHSHGSKGPNGGILEDVAGVHAELIASGNTVTINILNEENKPLATAGYTASALVVSGADRETLKLEPSGQNALKGEAKKPIAKGATISVTIKTPGGKSGQARYKL
jgi:hypothetical protein